MDRRQTEDLFYSVLGDRGNGRADSLGKFSLQRVRRCLATEAIQRGKSARALAGGSSSRTGPPQCWIFYAAAVVPSKPRMRFTKSPDKQAYALCPLCNVPLTFCT